VNKRVVYVVGFAAPPVHDLASLVALLSYDGWDSHVVLSPTAADWVDSATLADASGNPVRFEPRRPDELDPLPPADAVITAPITFNSFNKWAAGINDTLALGLLNEAIGYDVPITAAPCVKAELRRHPAYETSHARLTNAGIEVLHPDTIAYRTPSGALTLDWHALNGNMNQPSGPAS
jgi:phosphopantothenoylcysteine decarboxylase